MPALRTRDTPASLDVTTDTLQPPTVAIISPTPRAFTFPINRNEPSPFNSPSSSPFEPDLRPLAFTPSPPPLFRTLSPISPSTSFSSSATFFSSPSSAATASNDPISPINIHKRRKSSICSDVERRPKKGDEDYIKRPENAFILFRRKCCEDRQLAHEEASANSPVDAPTKKQRQADLSKTISQQWKSLSAEERQYWEELAKEKKKEHEQMYPNYVYRPQRTKDKDGKLKGKKKGLRGDFELETDTESNISFMLPLSPPTGSKHGRSASAPTPPLGRQMIQIPNVYMPSCPTSPSLLPMISRRSSHPDHAHNSSASQFDFIPNNTLMPPPRFTPYSTFGAGLNGDQFYQGMFDTTLQTPTGEKSDPSQLQPLTMPPNASALLSAQQMISPVSSMASESSGPSSPCSGPFSPVEALLSSTFSLHGNAELTNQSCAPGSQSSLGATDMPLDIQFDYSAYAWGNTGAWGDNSHMLLGEEFDLNSIPPIEIGLPKFGEETMQLGGSTLSASSGAGYGDELFQHTFDDIQYPNDARSQESFAGIFNFDDMLPGHGF